jgi:plastocyanin
MKSLMKCALLAGGMIAAVGCSNSTNPSTPSPTTPAAVSVSIVSGARLLTTTAYNPNPITVARGGKVTWTNNDTITHTATSDGGAFDSGNMAPGASFSMTFPTAGTSTYHCTLHPGMIGTVNVQ